MASNTLDNPLIEGKDVAVECIIEDRPGGHAVLHVAGENVYVPFSNQQMAPIVEAMEDYRE